MWSRSIVYRPIDELRYDDGIYFICSWKRLDDLDFQLFGKMERDADILGKYRTVSNKLKK